MTELAGRTGIEEEVTAEREGGEPPAREGDGPPPASTSGRNPDGEEAGVAPRSRLTDRPRVWPPRFGRGKRERKALLVLSMLDSVTPRRLFEVAGELGTARRCLWAVHSGRIGSDADRTRLADLDPAAIAAAVESAGARLVTMADPEYPVELEDLADPPAALFVRGDPIRANGVAVVGSRSCSALGREVARSIGRALAHAGTPVVSGAARGIDAAAHEGALDAGGPTIAVLGSGIDRPYPSTNRRLLERIVEAGTVLGEYPPGADPYPFRFPARNRLIAALASAVVIVEGEDGSGSLITADHALDLGRTVFAVPGAINSSLAEAPLWLLREGATPIRGAEDLLADLGLGAAEGTAPAGASGENEDASQASVVRSSGLPKDLEAVLMSLDGPTLADVVAERVGRNLPTVLGLLSDLEVRGLIRRVGGRFEPTLSGRPAPARSRRRPSGPSSPFRAGG